MAKETEEEIKAREIIEEIATNIAKLSREVSSLLNGRLKKNTILILLANSTRLPRENVERVLDAVANLEKTHLK